MTPHQWTELEDRSLVHGYARGENMENMEERMGISRSSLYRRLNALGIPAREPLKKNEGAYVPIKPYPAAHPLVRRVFAKARSEQVSLQALANLCGLTRETLGAWGRGDSPVVRNLVTAGECLGMELRWHIDE